MTVSINTQISGGGTGGGGAGTVTTVNSVSPDGGGNVLLKPATIGADAQAIIWNLDTNLATNPDASTFTPANGTIPTSGNNILYTTGTTPRTLDGNVYAAGQLAIISPSLVTWTQITSSSTTVNVPKVTNLTAGSSFTGVTTESATQMSLTMDTGTLVAGTKYVLDFQFATSNSNDTCIVKPYFNGSGTATPSAGFTVASFSSGGRMHMDATVISATSIAYEIITDLASGTRQNQTGLLTVTSGAGFSVAWTFQNSTNTKTAQAIMADCRIFR